MFQDQLDFQERGSCSPISTTPNYINIHHNPFITLLLGYKAKSMLAKQKCYIQTKCGDHIDRKICHHSSV